MEERLEKLIKAAYSGWKTDFPQSQEAHPGEEALACFLENRLSQAENERIKTHLMSCDICVEAVAVQLKLKAGEEKDVPAQLTQRLKDLAAEERGGFILEIFLKLKRRPWRY